MKLAQIIQDSDYYKIDPLLKKNLILMIQVSNRPKSISALGFFEFNWNSCSLVSLTLRHFVDFLWLILDFFSQVGQTTYSYLTIVRRILKL